MSSSEIHSPTINVELLLDQLPVHDVGFPLIYEPVIASTNALALSLLKEDAKHGTVILTDAQPEGRGRQGRAWITLPNQQILLSTIIAVPFAPHLLVMAVAVSVLDAVKRALPQEHVALKWPNDVFVAGKKAGGILIETRTNQLGHLMAVVGVGVNVNGSLALWPEVSAHATTLAEVHGADLAREPLILAYLENLGIWHQRLQDDPHAATELWNQWRNHIAHLGQSIHVHFGDNTLTGIAEDVAEDGALLLRLPDGRQHIVTWGDVEMISL